jgi:RNA polymerase sigma factor (sigma-70 family)
MDKPLAATDHNAVDAQPFDDDLQLARRIADGDARAFELLMRRHNRMLFRLARSILADDAESEEALQEAYIAVYRNVGSFKGGSKLSTWLARIVINEALGRRRKRARGVVIPFTDRGPANSEEDTMADPTIEQPDAAAMRAELRRLLERRIDELPEQFRTVFILRDVEEMSVEETAECLDVPPATVRTRAFRARALLRESLARDIDVATVSAFEFAGARCDRIVATVLDRIAANASAAPTSKDPTQDLFNR